MKATLRAALAVLLAAGMVASLGSDAIAGTAEAGAASAVSLDPDAGFERVLAGGLVAIVVVAAAGAAILLVLRRRGREGDAATNAAQAVAGPALARRRPTRGRVELGEDPIIAALGLDPRGEPRTRPGRPGERPAPRD